jgi:hypothetical protein
MPPTTRWICWLFLRSWLEEHTARGRLDAPSRAVPSARWDGAADLERECTTLDLPRADIRSHIRQHITVLR